MAPEQAQGLETLDHRADVWALAAIAYECLTSEVPFKGNNGPAILLEILTKNPRPPSELSNNERFPIPPGLDAVMARAFQKAASHRIPSVGELADQVGLAYGLTGTHKEWACRPQDELEASIVAKLPQLMVAEKVRDNAVDSFFGGADDLGDLKTIPAAPLESEPGESAMLPGASRGGNRWLMVAVISAASILAIIAGVLLFVL